MFTVIIAEKKHFEAIERNRLYFKPFLDRSPEDFAFCEWNPSGQTLYEAVPDLIGKVGRHKFWRAVIVQENSRTLCRNPYDYIDSKRIDEIDEKYKLINPNDEIDEDGIKIDEDGFTETDEEFETWRSESIEKCRTRLDALGNIYREALSYPLQRLATCLCFVEDDVYSKSTSKKSDVHDYAYEILNRTSFEKVVEELAHRYHLEEEALKNDIRKECVDKMLPGDGYSRTTGSMGIALPAEVCCIAERTTETGYFDPIMYWETHTSMEYSSFSIRNMYFDKMRFLVSDILPETHQDYRFDHIRFLYNLLLFALNDVPSGALLPRKLYCIESRNNEKPLRDLITNYLYKLDNTIDLVNGQIEKIKREIPTDLSDKEAEELFCTKVNLPIRLDEEFDENEMYAEKRKIGLSSNCPRDELTDWFATSAKSQNGVEKLVKQPRRSLKKAVDSLGRECEVDYNRIRVLNSFQMDDVREYTEDSEDRMVSTKVSNLFDVTRYHEKLSEEDENVRKVMNRRMRRKTTIALGAICIGLLLIGFLPLIFNNKGNVGTFNAALVISGIAAGLLAIVLVITLFFLRKPVKEAIASFNQAVREILNEVRGALNEYSAYLSCVCNVRRGYKVLNFSANNIDKYDRSIRTRTKHKNDMEVMRAFVLDNYGDFADEGSFAERMEVRPYDYDFSIETTEYDYLPPYLPEDQVEIEYLEVGNKVTVPSRFVESVILKMEEIYDE